MQNNTLNSNSIDKSKINSIAKSIELLIMDVDGVLTDGRLYYLETNPDDVKEFKAFNSLDGMGLHLMKVAGIHTGIISGGNSLAVNHRANILGIKYVYQKTLHKTKAFNEILTDLNLTYDKVAYMGDDLSDIPLLKLAALKIAPANAIEEVKQLANFVTTCSGGAGAVRQACELILKAKNLWESSISYFTTEN